MWHALLLWLEYCRQNNGRPNAIWKWPQAGHGIGNGVNIVSTINGDYLDILSRRSSNDPPINLGTILLLSLGWRLEVPCWVLLLVSYHAVKLTPLSETAVIVFINLRTTLHTDQCCSDIAGVLPLKKESNNVNTVRALNSYSQNTESLNIGTTVALSCLIVMR